MFSDFLKFVRTDQDREILIHEIDFMINSSYQTKSTGSLDKVIRSETMQIFEKAKSGERNFLGFLKSLRQTLLDIRTFEITLAIDPSEDLVNEIFSWFKANFEVPPVLSFKRNAELIGGAELAYLGKYYSFTLNKILDQELANHQESSLLVINQSK